MSYMSDEETKENAESLDEARNDSGESDDVVEFEFNDDGEEDLKKTLKKLRADLKLAKKEKEEYLTGWQKERADFANFKKQEDERRVMFTSSLRENMLTRFLTVTDSFNMAFANKEAWEKVDPNWRKGVEYIFAQLTAVFEDYGVKSVGEVGEYFDPNIHESIETVSTNEKDLDHKVAVVIQKGYKLGEKVLRPARVNVYEFKDGE